MFWFIAAMTLMGAYYSGMKINALDITPNYAGTTTAMVNGIAAISGIITPYLIGVLTPNVSFVTNNFDKNSFIFNLIFLLENCVLFMVGDDFYMICRNAIKIIK